MHKLFDNYRKDMEIYPPIPNLYFAATTIILSRRQDSLIRLRDSIVEHLGKKANVQTPK